MAMWFRIALPAALLLFGVVGFFAAVEPGRFSLSGLLAPALRLARRVRPGRSGARAEAVEPHVASGP